MIKAVTEFLKQLPLITYLKIGFFVLVCGIILFLNCRVDSLKKQNDDLKQSVDTAVAANTAQNAAIQTLTEQRVQDAVAVQQLLKDVTKINEEDRAGRRAIAELEKNNEDVRRYLALPIPSELRRVLSEGGE